MPPPPPFAGQGMPPPPDAAAAMHQRWREDDPNESFPGFLSNQDTSTMNRYLAQGLSSASARSLIDDVLTQPGTWDRVFMRSDLADKAAQLFTLAKRNNHPTVNAAINYFNMPRSTGALSKRYLYSNTPIGEDEKALVYVGQDIDDHGLGISGAVNVATNRVIGERAGLRGRRVRASTNSISLEETLAENDRLTTRVQALRNNVTEQDRRIAELMSRNNQQLQLVRSLQDQIRGLGRQSEIWVRAGRTVRERTIRRAVSKDLGLDDLNREDAGNNGGG